MGRFTFAGSTYYVDPQSADYPPSSTSGGTELETFTGTIDSALGYRDVTIEGGGDKEIVSVAFTGQVSPAATTSAEILDDTTLRVYSSLQTEDPGHSFTVSIRLTA